MPRIQPILHFRASNCLFCFMKFRLYMMQDYFLWFEYSIIVISKMIRQSAWKKQQSILEQDASNLSILKKEISKQSQIDASVQLSINEKIETLKLNATALAKKLENEKHKNAELETIITHLRNTIDKEKMEEASFRDSNSFESINGLEAKYKKLEYDLGQLNGKANRIAENVDEKKIKINQNRTERVIDSGIFRNIEKQLIQSELKFKKLLIEKIKYQKEYEKLLKNYETLKEQAESYAQSKQTTKAKAGRSETSLVGSETKMNVDKKFINLEINKQSNIQRARSMMKIDQEADFQEQQQIIAIKKLLVQTGLESCEQLFHNFFNIDGINDKYFNEMTVYTDQSNQIEKYLSDIQHLKSENKMHFYDTQKAPTKNETIKSQNKRLKSTIEHTSSDIKSQVNELTAFINQDNFKKFLKYFGLNDYTINQGETNFDELKEVLQKLQSHMHEILAKPSIIRQEKINTTSRSNQHDKLEDLINKVRKSDENMKVMKKQEFQEEYQKILKNSTSKSSLLKIAPKRQSSKANKK